MSEAARGYQPWIAPSIDPADAAQAVSAEEVAAVLEQARREGYQQGHAEGFSAGEKDVRQRVQRLEQLHRALSRPLEQVDEEIQRRIVSLSLSLAQQVLRAELSLHPERLLPLVREAVGQLSPGDEVPTIHLHPGDAALLRELLDDSGEGEHWQLVPDERVSAGGCRVHSGYMEIDATLQTRLQTMEAQLQALFEVEMQS